MQMSVGGSIRPAAGHGSAATECEHSHGVLITGTEPDRRLRAVSSGNDRTGYRAQIVQFSPQPPPHVIARMGALENLTAGRIGVDVGGHSF